MDKQDKEYEYYAFISYKREDEKWAKWLQKKLESYGFPVSLRKDNPSLPTKIRPVFRDQSDLSGCYLKIEIEKALDQSKFLIVVCSPRSAKSPWVASEIKYFMELGREEYIIPFIIEGNPNSNNDEECFPEDLRKLKGYKELLGVNINEVGESPAVLKVIARMFGLRFDTLWQRFEKERKKRQGFTLGIAILMASLAVAAGVFYFKSEIAYRELNHTTIKLMEASERLKEDSIITNRHLLRIQNDSVRLVKQRDSLQLTLATLHRAKLQIEYEQKENKSKKALMDKTKEHIVSFYASDSTNTRWKDLYVGIGGSVADLEYKKEQLRLKDGQREENRTAELINQTPVFGLQ